VDYTATPASAQTGLTRSPPSGRHEFARLLSSGSGAGEELLPFETCHGPVHSLDWKR